MGAIVKLVYYLFKPIQLFVRLFLHYNHIHLQVSVCFGFDLGIKTYKYY